MYAPSILRTSGGASGQSVGRLLGVLLLCGLLVSTAAIPVGARIVNGSLQNTTVSTSGDAKRKVVYANDSKTVNILWSDNSTNSLSVTADALGPAAQLDGDNPLEIPYVPASSSKLKIVETDGGTETKISSGVDPVSIAVGDLDADGHNAIFYSRNGKLHKYEPATGETVNYGHKTNGVGGLGDLDADAALELAYRGGSSSLKYLNPDGTYNATSQSAYGIGRPHDFDGDGKARIPVVGGSNNVHVVSTTDSDTTTLLDGVSAKKTRVALTNVSGSAAPEVVYVENKNSPAEYKFVTLGGTEGYLRDADGNTLQGTKYVGAASILAVPPEISEYDVSNPSGRKIEVSFNSSKKLTDIAVEITRDGTQVTTLTEADFEESGDGPYHYVGTYTADVDGNYTATLTKAIGPKGYDGASNQNETVTIDTPSPTVTNVTLTDLTDGNDVVDAGHEIRVTAEVANESTLTSVTANLSAFGAGTVSLSKVGGRWVANATVGTDVVDGAHDASVTAVNEYDHADTNRSGTLTVDTTPPVLEVPTSRTVDEDTKVTFDADSTDLTTVSYRWKFPDGSTASGDRTSYVFSDPGTYTVTVTATDAAGNSNSTDVNVDVQDVTESEPVPTVTNVTLVDATDGDNVVTAGDTVRVTAEVLNESNLTSVTADLSTLGVGTVTLTKTDGQWVATATVDADASSGTYRTSVTAVNEYDNADANESSKLVVDLAAPDVGAIPDRTVDEDTTVVFDADSTDLTNVSYRWEFPDGTTASGKRVTYSFADPGTYTVTVTATDRVGHTTTSNVTVDVQDVTTQTTETVVETETVYRERTRKGADVRWHATTRVAGENVSLTFENVSLRGLTFHGDVPAGNVTIEALAHEPPNASNAPGVVFRAFYVGVPWADRPGNATMRVTIPMDASLDAEHVYLARLTGAGWTLHDADRVAKTGDRTVFAGRTPGFSVVAVVYYPGGDVSESEYHPDGAIEDVDGTTSGTPTPTPSATPTPTATPAPSPATDEKSTASPTATPSPRAPASAGGGGGWFSPFATLLAGTMAAAGTAVKTLLGST